MKAVFAACYLMWGLVALHVVVAIGAFAALGEFHRYHSMSQGDELAGQAAALALLLFAVVSLVIALVFATLAILVVRGFPAARVITWVVCGLTLVLSVPVAAADVYDPAPWYGTLILIVTMANAALTISAIALLALPRSSNVPGKSRSPAPSRRVTPGRLRSLGGAGVLCAFALPLVLLAGGSAAREPARPMAGRHVEPPHEVVYWYTVPAAARTDRFEITYLDAAGEKQSLTEPGYPPAWVELVRLPRGGTALELIVRSSATSSAPMIYCRIQIDGRVERASDGNPCRVRLTFPLTSQANTNPGS